MTMAQIMESHTDADPTTEVPPFSGEDVRVPRPSVFPSANELVVLPERTLFEPGPGLDTLVLPQSLHRQL